jgi:hypothetical protein
MKAIGVTDLVKYQDGKKELTATEAIKAKCAECCAKYEDGKYDCGVTLCPLYPWMPYKGLDEDL